MPNPDVLGTPQAASLQPFHAKLFAEDLQNLVDTLHRFPSTWPHPEPADLEACARYQRLREVADEEVDPEVWDSARKHTQRLTAALNNGDVDSLACRRRTRSVLSCVWVILEYVRRNGLSSGEVPPTWPDLPPELVYHLQSLGQGVRQSEGFQYATPEEEDAAFKSDVLSRARNVGIVTSQGDYLARVLASEKHGISEHGVLEELLTESQAILEASECEEPRRRGRFSGWQMVRHASA